jgi:hypothetical protein
VAATVGLLVLGAYLRRNLGDGCALVFPTQTLHDRTRKPDMATSRDKISMMKSAMMSAMVIATTVIDVIAAAASASAEPDGTLTVEVLKYPTPVFGVRLADLVKGTPPNDMDITGPPGNERDMDGVQATQIYQIKPRSQPTTATAFYDVEQNGRHLGTFRVDFNLGGGGDPNNLAVTCNEQDSPIDCYAFENPFIVRVYPKDPARNS